MNTWQKRRHKYKCALEFDPYRAWAHFSLVEVAVLNNDDKAVEKELQLLSEQSPWACYERD